MQYVEVILMRADEAIKLCLTLGQLDRLICKGCLRLLCSKQEGACCWKHQKVPALDAYLLFAKCSSKTAPNRVQSPGVLH